jgi:hypothetical protein
VVQAHHPDAGDVLYQLLQERLRRLDQVRPHLFVHEAMTYFTLYSYNFCVRHEAAPGEWS